MVCCTCSSALCPKMFTIWMFSVILGGTFILINGQVKLDRRLFVTIGLILYVN
jgi:hypothetical protein